MNRTWTPDFRTGVAELELESIIRAFHLFYRSANTVSAALQVVGHPDLIRRRSLAWASVALEAGATALTWRRTEDWHSLRAPEILPMDTAIGVVSLTLAARAMSPEAHHSSIPMTLSTVRNRVASTPLLNPEPVRYLAASAAQLLPRLAWAPPGVDRRSFGPAGAQAVGSMGLLAFSQRRLRTDAATIDAQAAVDASTRTAEQIAAADSEFELRVLAPLATQLHEMERLLGTDRVAAGELAASEHHRLRSWLGRSDDQRDAHDVTEEPSRATVFSGNRRLTFGIRMTVRIGFSLIALRHLSRGPTRSTSMGRVTAAALAIRAAVSAALIPDPVRRRLGDRPTELLLGAVDVGAITAVAVHQRNEPGMHWAEEFSYEASATPAGGEWESPVTVAVHRFIATMRAGVALAERRPVIQRIAAAADEVLWVNVSKRLTMITTRDASAQAMRLISTAAELAAAESRSALDAQRLRQRAFVHDGVAQLLRAVGDETLDADQLRAWTRLESDRLDAVLTGHAAAPDSIEEALPGLVDEFRHRGLAVVAELQPLPPWTRPVAGTVVEIIREALNNVLAHTDSRSAWCEATITDGTVVIGVLDFSTGLHRVTTAIGTGVGTQTMIGLADLIGATVDWRTTPGVGTEVRLTLTKP